MDRPTSLLMLVLGLAIGLVAGTKLAVARRAWKDYTVTKSSVAGLRKTAWTLRRGAFTRAGLVILLLIAAMSYAASGQR
ncbi:hypothetical protein [Plantactinospora sp. GCM10030261]|uniref:hypothetical protein n=1 Tax=Plantactinospora sp. GCM10030261 TaxID=3273420 RepID=UPI0036062FE6